jgi:hypothetical protein
VIVLYIAAAVAIVLVGLAAGFAILGISDDIHAELDERQASENSRPKGNVTLITPGPPD